MRAADEEGRFHLRAFGAGLEISGEVLAAGGGEEIQAVGFALLEDDLATARQ